MGPLIWLLACWPVGAAASGPKHLVKGVHNGLLRAHTHTVKTYCESCLCLSMVRVMLVRKGRFAHPDNQDTAMGKPSAQKHPETCNANQMAQNGRNKNCRVSHGTPVQPEETSGGYVAALLQRVAPRCRMTQKRHWMRALRLPGPCP